MAASQNLRRLHSIREAEESQRRTQMESALAKLRFLQNTLKDTLEKATQARALIGSSVRSGDQVDRIAALQEMRGAERQMTILPARIAAAEADAASIRQEFLAKRIERRQVESLLDAASSRKMIEANRKSQSVLDEWHLSQRIQKSKSVRSKTSEV
jgi:hypothetical protein